MFLKLGNIEVCTEPISGSFFRPTKPSIKTSQYGATDGKVWRNFEVYGCLLYISLSIKTSLKPK